MAGRPTERNDEINRKIDEAAAIGASIEEIAFYAGVHRATLYRWMENDPELRDRIQELQEKPIIKARQTIVKSLEDPEMALKYLERKRKAEFSLRTEMTGADGKDLPAPIVSVNRNVPTNDSVQQGEQSNETN